ncbi:MAG: hypothetical protein M1450_02630 [Patescibacteria group bacterium]|nr:hypothetical protein [Patescibacteria group bacterium]
MKVQRSSIRQAQDKKIKTQKYKLRFKIFSFLFFIFIFHLSFLIFHLDKAKASSFALSVFPPVFQIEAKAPATVKSELELENLSDENLSLQILLREFEPKENGGISYLQKGKTRGEDPKILDKISILDKEEKLDSLKIAAKQKKKLTLIIDIPKDEPPSDYYFSIIFSSKGQDEKEKTSSRTEAGIATNVLLSIGEKGKTQGLIEEFNAPFFLEKGPVPFTLKIRNNSKHFIVPKGGIIIKNMFGQEIGKVDLLPSNVLVDSTREFTDSLRSTQDKVMWQENFLLGLYTANLKVALSENGPILSRTIHFFAFPFQGVVGLFIALLIILLVRERIKRYRKVQK